MEQYTIIKTEQLEEVIYTTVEYNFDGTLIVCEIPHFMPPSKEAVIEAIENRMASEKRKLDAITLNRQIINEL